MTPPKKPPHPYTNAPAERVWRRAVSEPAAQDVDPVGRFPFRIAAADKVVSAGSCFAQHISRRLRTAGFNFLVTEPGHPILPPKVAETFHYGDFSARYGNIYTARQLLQLHQRAYGEFTPKEQVWESDGRFFDPFRPQIQPNGFATRLEFDLDRQQHFAAVRAAFEQMDVFVFTLGLTECWASREDGAVYPVCPGTAAGTFDPTKYVFHNFSIEEVVADLSAFLAAVRKRNPKVRTILTVSPVPLAATAEDRHVVVSTTYSKSVLRVAAETLCRDEAVAYFPSYEVITAPFSRGRYFADDLRQVTDAGVDHVMRLFFKHVAEEGVAPAPAEKPADTFLADSAAAVAALCDEDALDDGTR